jgi:hypothetical protein
MFLADFERKITSDNADEDFDNMVMMMKILILDDRMMLRKLS